MSSITITCPECGAEFDAAEQLDKHFQEFKLKDQSWSIKSQKFFSYKWINPPSRRNTELMQKLKTLKYTKKDMEGEIEASKRGISKGF